MGDNDGGILLIGDDGAIMAGCYGESPRIVPESAMKKYKRPRKTLERIPEGSDGHEQDWIRACKGGKPASSNFEYSGPLSETVLMGNLAVRFPGRPAALEWRSHGSDQRQGCQRLRPAGVPGRLAPLARTIHQGPSDPAS